MLNVNRNHKAYKGRGEGVCVCVCVGGGGVMEGGEREEWLDGRSGLSMDIYIYRYMGLSLAVKAVGW